MRILVCEDEENLNRLISKKLKLEGYAVDSCFNGEEGLYYVEQTIYDLVILDVMMPIMDGHQLLDAMRKAGIEYPVLFLTAKDSNEDIVEGLDLGANDYVIKPFTFDVLLARVRMLLRTRPRGSATILSIYDMKIDISKREVRRNNEIIVLSAKEYAIVEYLAYNKDVVVTKEQIEENIWDYDSEIGTGLVKVYISYLRKKLDDPYERKLIHTVRGIGYVLRSENNESKD
ncbi:response regulator transcription factor [Tannockella kyphosi]|uniref:response regulator transcription factor n=1 Tax=Tannockella kyphosi TaxID=2899121 RepID=UPI002013794E|nr:response regulator transcription factor [Tannockella kyphosi]